MTTHHHTVAVREFRANLRLYFQANTATLVGDEWNIRGIFIPIKPYTHYDRASVPKTKAETKRRFAAALRLAWPN